MQPIVYANTSHAYHAESSGMHPEAPARIEAIMKRIAPYVGVTLTLKSFAAEGVPTVAPKAPIRSWTLKDGDTYKTAHTDAIVKETARMVHAAIDDLLEGKTRCAFVLARPPGHHASVKGPAGFCHANATWLAVQELVLRGKRKLAIYDWDVHHGDGTQDYVESAVGEQYADLRFVSTHAYGRGIYPGTGAYEKTERVFSLPLRPGIWHEPFLENFQEEVLPFLQSAGKPDLLIVSAGYDGHEDDPLHLMDLTANTYRCMSRELRRVLECPVLFLLEGGYDPGALADSVLETLEAWM